MTTHTDFDTFIQTAWADHAEQPEHVAQRLQEALAWLDEPERTLPFVRLVTHVFGEHLARWDDGVALLEATRQRAGWQGSAAEEGAVLRGVAVLEYGAGRPQNMEALSLEDQATVLATVSSALAEQGDWHGAIAALQDAEDRLESIEDDLPATSPALRALAVGGNNLASGLQRKPERDALETQGMIDAAEIGLTYWTVAGTWLNQERAEYMLARSWLRAGEYALALGHAQRCAAICASHDAPAFEHFFAFALLGIAYRASGRHGDWQSARNQALAYYAQVPEDERRWCAEDLAELESGAAV